MACKCCKEDAPYKLYKHTDASMYQSGVDSARAWRSHWNHLPGGPWVCKDDSFSNPSCDDWKEYCATTARHNRVWLQGWHDGMKRYHPAQYKRIVGKAVYDKLAA